MEIKRTITSIFMVPTIGVSKERLLEHDYINGYSRDLSRDVQYKDSVYVLFHPKNLDKFRIFLDNEYDRTKSVIDDYDYPDGYVVVVYQLNPIFKPDFDLIRKGKYSKTSKNFQKMFPIKQMITDIATGLRKESFTLQYKVFTRSKDMILYWEDALGISMTDDQEIWHMFKDETETLNIDKIKEYVQ